MTEYEIIVETINPCGGEQYAEREILEAEIESPEAYVAANARFPVLDTTKNAAGDTVIITGNAKGYRVRYTFSL